MKCKLSLIIEGMDRAKDCEQYYLNIKNGRVFVSTELGIFYIDDVQKLDEDILYADNIISLPGQYVINEYKIVKNFIETIKDHQTKSQLLIVIQGNEAFRRFKDSCINISVIKDWFKYRDNTYYELAKE